MESDQRIGWRSEDAIGSAWIPLNQPQLSGKRSLNTRGQHILNRHRFETLSAYILPVNEVN